ncbi:SUMF1/EgtB/PvdO family nonheme iron enzyme [Desulfobacter curvatus]|uniref:SUMF1/EgtB/PvdO family nonheme iron enzyme n=1 Tax=Desulfobacter curvatus TaxID=2290 RepID=UPI000370732B|nr:SUMF1/EgtB/PvdO family nonheme iron enzyme [Desulfobacter curvatus]
MMDNRLNQYVRAIVSAVSKLARNEAPQAVKTAYQTLKATIKDGFGIESDFCDALGRLEKNSTSKGFRIVLEEVMSAIKIEDHPQVLAALEKLIKAGDHIDIQTKGDVAFAKDQAVALIIKNVTVQQGKDDPEALLGQYFKALSIKTNHLPWAAMNEDYADPRRGENLSLAQVYTALDTTTMERPESEDEVRKHLRGQKEARRISAQEMIDTESKLVLLGDPGSGKSTLVNYLTHILAQAGLADSEKWLSQLENKGAWTTGLVFPVHVVLREFAVQAQVLNSGRDAAGTADVLLDYLENTVKPTGFWPVLNAFLLDEKITCLFLLDGLDEVPESQRKIIVRIIDTFAAQFTWHRYLVTCRIYAYIGQSYQLGGFQQTTLMPFNKEQIQSFICAWYRELEHRGRFTEIEADSKAEKLKDVAVKPDLIGLAERPLLLTVMALLHTFRGQLPEDRVELYQKTVELLMERWEGRYSSEKGILETLETPGLKMRNLYSGFYAAAFDAHSQSKNNQDTGEIKEGDLRQHFAQMFNDDWNKAGKLVEYIRDRVGLLIRHKPAAYTFPHRTFQEFMAACHLVGMNDFPLEAARRLREDADRWRIVFVLAAGYAACQDRPGDAVSLVNHLLSECVQVDECYEGGTFHLAAVAGEALLEIGLVSIQQVGLGKTVLRKVQQWLQDAMGADHALAPADRVAAGNVLSRLGDPRFDKGKWYLPVEENHGFVDIPAGGFQMGSDKDKDAEARDNEFPQHTVVLSEFAMARYPVTVAQYKVFAEETKRNLDDDWKRYNRYDNHPVVEVSWDDAKAYCEWIAEKLDIAGCITLPTEAQWEKAAKGRDGKIYPWADVFDPNKANCRETGIGITSPVGCFPKGRRPYEIMEMSGNVYEWCLDDKREYNEETVEDPIGHGAFRVLRGGSWIFSAEFCRSANRFWIPPDFRYDYIGFRLVRLPGQQGESGQ